MRWRNPTRDRKRWPPSDPHETPILNVRGYRPGDAIEIARVISETIDSIYAPVYPPSVVEFFKSFHSEERIAERATDGHVLVVEENEEIIGTGGSDENRIFGMFVLPEHQGRGLGKRLMTELETRLKSDGHHIAVLSMSLPSEAFYRGLGYQDTETHTRTMHDGEVLTFADATKQL